MQPKRFDVLKRGRQMEDGSLVFLRWEGQMTLMSAWMSWPLVVSVLATFYACKLSKSKDRTHPS